MKDIIIGSMTALSIFGGSLFFGICLVVTVQKFAEDRKNRKMES